MRRYPSSHITVDSVRDISHIRPNLHRYIHIPNSLSEDAKEKLLKSIRARGIRIARIEKSNNLYFKRGRPRVRRTTTRKTHKPINKTKITSPQKQIGIARLPNQSRIARAPNRARIVRTPNHSGMDLYQIRNRSFGIQKYSDVYKILHDLSITKVSNMGIPINKKKTKNKPRKEFQRLSTNSTLNSILNPKKSSCEIFDIIKINKNFNFNTNLTSEIIDILANCKNNEQIIRLLWLLGESNNESVVPTIKKFLNSSNWRIRFSAIWTLMSLHSYESKDLIFNMLINDENENVREMAAWALGEL